MIDVERYMSKKNIDSNLFKIDIKTVEKILKEANVGLIEESERLIKEAENFPDILDSEVDLQKFRIFIQELNVHKKDLAQSRLSDSKPFSNATKRIKSWYEKVEKEIKSIEIDFSKRINTFITLMIEEEKKNTQKNFSEDPEVQATTLEEDIEANSALEDESEPIGIAYSGEPIVSYESEDHQEIRDIPTVWDIDSFDRKKIPFEKLRNYFSDSSILLALKKHLTSEGPNKLEGVKYSRVLDKKAKYIHDQSTNTSLTRSADDIFQELKLLRKNLANERKIPPYSIFKDEALKEMANKKPVNKDEFSKIKGVGEWNKNFAESFLSVINK